mgnify:CR=1 FL=1
MSAAGAPLAMYQSFVEPTSAFNLNYSVSALAMPIIGGTAHWAGPIIGAVLLGGVQSLTGPLLGATVFTVLHDTLTRSTEYWRAVLGGCLLALVLLFPQGIAGSVRALGARWRMGRAA